MTDPVTTALAKKAIDSGSKAAEGVLTRLLGPAADELGAMLQERIQRYRRDNMERTFALAEQRLVDSGLEAEPIPDNLLLPLLEGASLEGNEEMQARWAGLIASAASGNLQQRVHPAFARVLTELTAQEALLLEELSSKHGKTDWSNFAFSMAIKLKVHPQGAFGVELGNLVRLGLWTHDANSNSIRRVEEVETTAFGRAFLMAVQGPRPKGAPL